MTTIIPALAKFEAELPLARRAHERGMLRRKAANYSRDAKILLTWTFPASRDAVAMGAVYPYRPDITREICHRLYRDLQDAKALPTFFRRRHARIQALRELFACECWTYRNQKRRAMAQAAE